MATLSLSEALPSHLEVLGIRSTYAAHEEESRILMLMQQSVLMQVVDSLSKLLHRGLTN